MSHFQYEGTELEFRDSELVLDCLLGHGLPIPHGCRAGHCQSCILIDSSGQINAAAQKGLSAELRQRNAFLACQAQASDGLTLRRLRSDEKWQKCAVRDIDWIAPEVLRLRLESRAYWQVGQYFTLSLDGEQSRCFSAANSAQHSPYLEFHLRHHPQGIISDVLASASLNQASMHIWLGGPLGDCVYDSSFDGPLLLIGRGTGLAPVQAIAQQVMINANLPGVTLLGYGRATDRAYWQSVSKSIEDIAPPGVTNLAMQFQEDDVSPGSEPLNDYLTKQRDALRQTRVFIFGNPVFVSAITRQCLQGGIARRNIATESFLDCGPEGSFTTLDDESQHNAL